MKTFTQIDFAVRGAILFVFALLATAAVASSGRRERAGGDEDPSVLVAARRPLVMVSGQIEQLPVVDYILSQAGASFNSTPPTGAGDIEVTTINGVAPGTGTISGLTANTIPKASSATAIANSLLTDNGTTLAYNANKFTVASASGNTVVLGSLTADGGARVFDVAGNGISNTQNRIDLNITPTSCSAGNFVSAISALGEGTCTPIGMASAGAGAPSHIAAMIAPGVVRPQSVWESADVVAAGMVTAMPPSGFELGLMWSIAPGLLPDTVRIRIANPTSRDISARKRAWVLVAVDR